MEQTPRPETVRVPRLKKAARYISYMLRPSRLFELESQVGRLVDAGVILHRENRHQREIINELEEQAARDPSTGLLHKAEWRQNLESMIDAAESNFGVLFIDLNNLKLVNDTLGHNVGDLLIELSARILQLHLRDDQDAGRLGGDEFALICDLMPRPEKDELLSPTERLAAIEERLRLELRTMFDETDPRLEGLQFGAAIGGCVWRPGMTASELLGLADQAMYADKRAQKAI